MVRIKEHLTGHCISSALGTQKSHWLQPRPVSEMTSTVHMSSSAHLPTIYRPFVVKTREHGHIQSVGQGKISIIHLLPIPRCINTLTRHKDVKIQFAKPDPAK